MCVCVLVYVHGVERKKRREKKGREVAWWTIYKDGAGLKFQYVKLMELTNIHLIWSVEKKRH